MGTLSSLLAKAEAFNPELAVYQSLKACENDLGDINREQMYDGKTNQGRDISPTYLEDPYFKTIADAQAYSDWKDRITPNPRRRRGVPNLFINGYYHSTIQVLVLPDKIVFNSSFNHAREITDTFKNIYGLGGPFKALFLKQYFMPVWRQKIKEELGLKLGV